MDALALLSQRSKKIRNRLSCLGGGIAGNLHRSRSRRTNFLHAFRSNRSCSFCRIDRLIARTTISSDALRRASDTLSLPASSTSGAMPDAGNERKCLRSRSALGLNDAYVIPPDTTPPITGTAFPAVFANVFFVTLIPMAPRIFFIRGYQARFS